MEKDNILFHDSPEEYTIDLSLLFNKSNLFDSGQNVSIAHPKIWSILTSNRSDVYMHVLAIQEDVKADVINATFLQSGFGLYGMVGMVKYDPIPSHYHHRYLLSDFGYVQMSDIEGIK